jgi:phage terminase large subunit GpA-like protein
MDDDEQASAVVRAIWREFLRPAAVQTVTEWSEANIVLSSKDSAEPGPYRASRTPYAIQPQNDLSAHSPVEEVILMWGAQTSKTRLGSNWLGYLADTNPGPVMIVQPTIDMAKRYSRQRLAPMIEESAALRRKVRENRSRDDANTTLLKEFPGGFMAVAGANSAAGLRSMPVRDLFLDEVDGYPLDVDGEGDPCQLAEARQTTFARRKRLKTSTPTIKGVSRIEAAFQASRRHHYHLACPHCGEHQVLEWGASAAHGIKWRKGDDGTVDRASVHYVCRVNGCVIQEHHKPGMLAGGVWVCENPDSTARAHGYQLSSLYSPLGWLSWGELAEEWVAAMQASREGDNSLLRVFVNTRLAETYEDQGERTEAHVLQRRAEPYRLGTVPWGGLLITQAVDVQGDRLEGTAYAWGRGEESWTVDTQVWHGDPAIPEGQPGSLWDRVTEWRHTPLRHASGATMLPRACAIDSGGHHTHLVYTYARRWDHEQVLAVKGSSQPGRPVLGKPSPVDINHQGRVLKKGARLWLVGTDTAKGLIYARLRNEQAGAGYIHFSTDLLGAHYEQLTAERRITRYHRGHPRHEWVKPNGKRNEQLDLAVYNLVAAYYLGVHRYTDVHWQRLEQQVRQPDLLGMAAPPAAPPLPVDSQAATITPVAPENQPQPEEAAAPPPAPGAAPTPEPAAQTQATAPSTLATPLPPVQPRPAPRPTRPVRPGGRSGFSVKRW